MRLYIGLRQILRFGKNYAIVPRSFRM